MHKGKKLLVLLAVTLGVYLSFKFLLPLGLPFLAAYWLSLLLKPQVKKVSRVLHLPLSLSMVIVLILWLLPLGALLLYVGEKLLSQVSAFVSMAPVLVDKVCECISDICCRIDYICGIEDGTIYCWLGNRYEIIVAKAEAGSMDYFMGNGIPILSAVFNGIAVLIIIVIVVVLCASSWERIKKWRSTSVFRREIDRISAKLLKVAVSFLGAQLTIMVLTSIISAVGLMILGNKYSVLFGIGIGLMDVLPIFGTGTVYIPWIIYLCVSGNYYRAAIVMTIYIICYFLREVLEAKLMGSGIGMGSLETLISIYIGFRLFGLAGAILGPVGFIIIRELVEMYCGAESDNTGSRLEDC